MKSLNVRRNGVKLIWQINLFLKKNEPLKFRVDIKDEYGRKTYGFGTTASEAYSDAVNKITVFKPWLVNPALEED